MYFVNGKKLYVSKLLTGLEINQKLVSTKLERKKKERVQNSCLSGEVTRLHGDIGIGKLFQFHPPS